MNGKSISKKVARWAVVIAAILVIVPAILFGLAQTEIGKRHVAGQVAKGLGVASNAGIEVGKIEGIIPFDCRMDRLIARDVDGEMLVLKNARLRWSPLSLLSGRLLVKEISASLLRLNRFPSKEKRNETTTKNLPTWPSGLNRLIVERLAVDQLVLGRKVIGEEGIFRVEAQLRALNAADEQTAEIQLARIDGPKGEATLNITFQHKEPSLRLRAKVEEAEGGVLAGFMNVPGPTALNLEGTGPLADWKGTLKVRVGGLGELKTSLILETMDTPKLKAEGKIRVTSGRLPVQVRRLLSDETRFAAALRMPHSQSIGVDYLNVDGDKISLRLKGGLDFKQHRSSGEFLLSCGDLSPLGDAEGAKITGSVEVNGRFSGPLFNPQTKLLVSIRNVAFDKFRADAMHADLRIGLLSPLAKEFSGIKLSGMGSLENFVHLDARPMPEKQLRWNIDAEGPLKEIVQIRTFELSGEAFSLETSGHLNLIELSGKGDASLTVEDLQKISGLFKADIPGSTKTHVSFAGNATKRVFTAQIQGQLNMSEAPSFRRTPLLGSSIGYAAELKYTDKNKVSISKLQVDTETGRVTGAASLDLASQELDSALRIVVPKLAFLSPVLTRTIDGSLEMEGVITGTLSSPKVNVKANAKNLVFEQLNLQTLTANINTEGLPPSIQGRSELSLKYAGQALSGSSDFSLEGARLGLSALSIKTGENELTGHMALDLKSLLVGGELQVNSPRLSDLSLLFGEDSAGGVEIKTKFEIVNRTQEMRLDLDGRNLKSRFGHAKELDLKARLVDPFNTPSGNFELKGSGFRFGEVTLADLALTGNGSPEKMRFHGRSSGNYKESFDVQTRGILHATSKAQTLELQEFGAHYQDLPLKLRAPASVQRSALGYRVKALSLRVGAGQLDGSGRLENQTLTLKTDFKNLPLADLKITGAPQFTGTATGSLSLLGPIGRPQGSLNLSLDGVSIRDAKGSELPSATLNAKAELKAGRLRSNLALQGLTAEPLAAKLDIPLLFSFSPFTFSLPSKGEILGNLSGDLDLERINTLVGPDYQIVKGHFGVNLALRGTMDAPLITGQGQVGKGSYEYIPTGTVVRDVEVEITAEIPRVNIKEARATDGEKGSISLNGWFDLLPGDRFPFKTALTLEQATLLRRDDITATAGGRVTLAGSAEKANLAGKLRVEHAEIRIPDRLPPDITELEVIDVRETAQEKEPMPQPGSKQGLELRFDLGVDGPGKIFVRGRGLDSEWKCELHIAGTAPEPVITGNLSVVRGRFSFLGKRFGIQRGTIAFNGAYPPSPVADIVTEARATDITAQLRLSGSLKNPKLTLTSDPQLPSDEILSRLLFGRALGAITPFQALVLADAARTLAGGGSLGLLDQTRSALGIDQLEIKSGGEETDQATVGAGKYLSDKVYLEVEQGLDPQSSKAKVQVEVTPNVSVESEVGANSEGGMGVRWRWDY